MRVLILDDDRDVLVSITNVLHAEYPHLEVRVAATAEGARSLVAKERFDLLLASDRLSPQLDGLGVMNGIHTVPFRKPVDPERLLDAVRGVREGAEGPDRRGVGGLG